MDKIIDEFDRVLAELRRTAPGLFGIHAAFDKVLGDLREHTSTPSDPVFTVTSEWTAPPDAAPTIAPGVLVGMGGGGGGATSPVTVTESDESKDEADDEDEPAEG